MGIIDAFIFWRVRISVFLYWVTIPFWVFRAGTTYCSSCGEAVRKDTVEVVAEAMAGEAAGSRWYALFPVHTSNNDAGQLRDHLFELRRKGFNRLYQGGKVFEFSTPESLLDIDFSKVVSVMADRVAITPSAELRSRFV